MKKILFLTTILALIITSCNHSSCELIGTWNVYDVKTDFDEKRTTPQMLEQLVDIEKQNQLKFIDDSSLLIVTKDNVYEAIWKMDKNNVIYYHFKKDTTTHKLAVYQKPFIITKSKTKIGTMTTTYEKE
jgi:hypothetical protein